MTQSDLDLLRDYARGQSQEAFATLVRRHVNLVHSAALRQVRSPELAEEVAQSFFTDLAQNAAKLSGAGFQPAGSLTPWLYSVTRRTAIDVIRKESRRQLREQIATEMNAMNATTADWTQIEPLLDDAMSALDETDRAAVLLRYFENKSLREVGATLGTSDDAAQKRVSRAVERLREFFAKRGITIGASGLVVVISANAVQAAPVGLAITISTAAALTGATIATTATATAVKTIAMTTLQKTIIGTTLAVAVGAGVYEAHQASQLRKQNQTSEQQQSVLTGQLQQLMAENERISNLVAQANRAEQNSTDPSYELLRLRAEVARLRNDSQELARLRADPTGAAEQVAKIKARLEQMPEKKIPELQFLTDQEWEMYTPRGKGETEEDYRYAFSRLRLESKEIFARWLGQALHNYAKANNGFLPTDLSQLKPYFTPPVADANGKRYDPPRYELLPVDDAILQRYQLVQTGKLSDVPQVGTYPPIVLSGNAEHDSYNAAQREKNKTNLPWTEPVIVEKAPMDDQFDSLLTVTVYGYSYKTFGRGTGSGSGTFAKAVVGTNGVPELVDPVPAVGRRWSGGGGGFGGGSGSAGGNGF